MIGAVTAAIVAEMIADKTGGDLFEILPKEDYYPYAYDELTGVVKQDQVFHDLIRSWHQPARTALLKMDLP